MATWQHLRSSTANKRPTTSLADGRIAINTNTASPGLFFKDSAGTGIVKVGPVHVGTTAPNSVPAAGGSSGNYTGEQWLDTSVSPAQMKVWNGSTWVGIVADELPVSKLQDGAARQLIQTDAAGTGVEWTSDVDVPGTLDVTSTATFDSIAQHPLGTAGAPTITFTGDNNTGIYSPGADQVAISTNGTKRIEIQADGDIDIDNGGVFYDATNNRLAIGTATPSAKLEVSGGNIRLDNNQGVEWGGANNYIYGNESTDFIAIATNGNERARIDSSGRWLLGTSSSSASAAAVLQGFAGSSTGQGILQLQVGKNTAATGINENLGSVRFANSDGNIGAWISGEADLQWNSGDYPSRLVFSTTADEASSPTERMRIHSGGNVSIWNSQYVHPITDNATGLGLTGFRWASVWAANGTIQTSDQRAKTNVADAALGTDFIKALRPVSYKWIEGGKRDTGERDEDNNYIYESVPGERTHWGFIAQEVKQAVDAAGVDFGGWVLTDKDDPDSQQALRYDQFIAPLTKALQETMAELEALKAEVAALKAQ